MEIKGGERVRERETTVKFLFRSVLWNERNGQEMKDGKICETEKERGS